MWLLVLAFAFIENDSYWSEKNWSIFDNDESCSMVGSYEHGSLLWISHDIGLNKATFVITSSAFKSVTNEKEYSLSLKFVKKDKLDEGWGLVKSQGFVTESSKGVRFVLNANDALADVAESDVIALTREDVVVASLSLAGSAPAVAKLRQCASAANVRSPSDPLEGAEINGVKK